MSNLEATSAKLNIQVLVHKTSFLSYIKNIFANQGLRSSTHTFSSPLVYLTTKSKVRAKLFDWMQPEFRCTYRENICKQVTRFVTMKT